MNATITFDYEKSTKGTHRYKEQGDRTEWLVGTLYVKRTAFDSAEPPAMLTLTLATASEGLNPPAPRAVADPPQRRRRKAS